MNYREGTPAERKARISALLAVRGSFPLGGSGGRYRRGLWGRLGGLGRIPVGGAELLPLVLPPLDDAEAGFRLGFEVEAAHLLEDLLQRLVGEVVDPEL